MKVSRTWAAVVCTGIAVVAFGGGILFRKLTRERRKHRPSASADYRCDFENDPIAKAFHGKVPPLLETILSRHEAHREYDPEGFPLSSDEPAVFREKVRQVLIRSMDGPDGKGERWLVDDANEEASPLSGRFKATHIDTVEVHGRQVQLFTLTIGDTGDAVPVALCLPDKLPAPGVAVFSGHSYSGLRDLVVDLDSYQSGMAMRLCKAGFAAIAVPKIDSGIMSEVFQQHGERSREGRCAEDEPRACTTLLASGDYILPARQLMANIAAVEFLAGQEGVDRQRIAAAGVSLGGWLSLQTALVNKRITAVANFGGMWAYLAPPSVKHGDLSAFVGVNCCSQLFPGVLRLGDQNCFVFAVAPLPMLAGYGAQDEPYVQYKKYFHPAISEQYKVLGKPANVEVFVHDGGHVMPHQAAIDYLRRRLMSQDAHADRPVATGRNVEESD